MRADVYDRRNADDGTNMIKQKIGDHSRREMRVPLLRNERNRRIIETRASCCICGYTMDHHTSGRNILREERYRLIGQERTNVIVAAAKTILRLQNEKVGCRPQELVIWGSTTKRFVTSRRRSRSRGIGMPASHEGLRR